MPDVTAITVAYSSIKVLPGMAASLPADVPLIVVNNGLDDGLAAWTKAQGLRLLTPGRNLGFGTACNLGAAEVTSDYLLFLNPDARLEPDALTKLLSAAASHPEASALGPMLMSEDGSLGYKRRSFLNRADAAPVDPGPDPRPVPSLSGAAMLIRRRAFEAVGGFDPDIFLYYEDDDLAFRLNRAGFAGGSNS